METARIYTTGKENVRYSSPKNSQRQSGREFPSTPAGRVPLAELFDNDDENKDRSPGRSPVEAVSWNKSPQSIDPNQSFTTPMVSRKRKRPRSNSANASVSKDKAPTRSAPQGSLKTPRNDPAYDFESRYFGQKHQTPSKPASSAAPDFMHSSSPQTPVPAIVDNAGLKRTRSCGVAWPSASKRRKVEESKTPQPIQLLRKVSEQNDGEMEQISLMLDSIHNELPATLHISQASSPPRSCPMPNTGAAISEHNSFPSISRQSQTHAKETSTNRDERCVDERASQASSRSQELVYGDIPDVLEDTSIFEKAPDPKASQKSQGSKKSDYGDFPDDLEDFIGVGVLSSTQPGRQRTSPKLPQLPHPVQTAPILLPQASQTKTGSGELEDLDDDHFDEFDDDDAEELELLASICESKPSPRTVQSTRHIPPQRQISFSIPHNSTPIDHNQNTRQVIEISDDDDEFDEGIDNDFCDDLYQATQDTPKEAHTTKSKPALQRYVIVSASDSTYTAENGSNRPEKVLQLEDVKNRGSTKAALLRQSWMEGVYPDGCIVHVLGDFDARGHCIIDDRSNWLVVHPDHLVSATVVADSFGCIRRAVLQDRVKATSGATEPLVYGHILHEVFQEGMKVNKWDNEWLEATITTVCARYLEALFEINIDLPLAVNNLLTKAAGLQAWAEIFVSHRPKPEARVLDRGRSSVLMSINKLLEVEEHIWSPKYGLKGNIDATVQVTMIEGEIERTLTVPLELKTGRNTSNTSHQAQTALYTLLLSDRYDVEVTYGVLFYLETSSTNRITGIRNEVMSMIQQRNKIATYVKNREVLPPMLKDHWMCGKCYAKTSCFISHKLVEDGDGSTSGLKDEFTRLVKHLKPIHKDFFIKWDMLLSKEEVDAYKFRKELWTMSSAEREKVGRCFGGLILDPVLSEEMADAPKINRYKYTLVKQKLVGQFSFTESQITIGEPIVISDESGHYALANGYVSSVRPNRITVSVDRRLRNMRTKSKQFDPTNNQSFLGIMQVEGPNTVVSQDSDKPIIYRLDKDEFSNGMATIRNNLIRIMDSDAFGTDKLRALIVEGKEPQFTPIKGTQDWISSDQASLNVDQRKAIEKVMSANDYALVLGMPGTGKTTTIAHIIRALVAKGKSVLLTSYTHTAVDNILLKVRDEGISILRLGATAKIHPEVQRFADLASEPEKTFEGLKKSYAAQVVATTCLGVNHPIFNSRVFDYCIVDEASQITLPVCLGPIAMARHFVLVGDHFQLPPLVQNKEASEGGLDVSLFKLLSDSHPESVVSLEHQYRMCEDIMSLSNALIYSGRLKCGTTGVAASSMRVPNMAALKSHHHTAETIEQDQMSLCRGPDMRSCWLRECLDPSRRVVFLNTDRVGPEAQEIVNGTRVTNSFEVTIATQAVEALLAVGVPATEVGVITLYRSQLALLKHSLRHRSPSSYMNPATAAVEMHTADKFQGRDKEAIVLSLVRSNDNGSVGDLLQDWRRVNVALTRARTKLIIIGSFSTISQGTELLGRFCSMCHDRGWVFDLREGAAQAHHFEEWKTQTQLPSAAAPASKQDKPAKVDVQPESDIEVASSGRSPKKAALSKRKPMAYTNKPFKQVKFAAKHGTTDARRLLSGRVVLGDIMNEVMGPIDDKE